MNNRYGLDASYFSNKMSRIIRDIGSYKPDEFARECARMSRTADESVMREQEFAPTPVPPGTGSDTLDCILGVGGFASFGPLDAQPVHLTIPGALEWDGDNGTHGVVGTHGADGESVSPAVCPREAVRDAIAEALGDTYDCTRVWSAWGVGTMSEDDFSPVRDDESRLEELTEAAIQAYDVAEVNRLRAQLANTEQSRRSFFDLSQDLEKRLAYMVEAMNQIVQVSSMYEKPFEIATLAIGELSAMVIAPECLTCSDLGAVGNVISAETCPDCTPLSVEAGVMNAPKPYVTMTEAEVDEFLSSFGGGSGNKAKRRIAAMEKAKGGGDE